VSLDDPPCGDPLTAPVALGGLRPNWSQFFSTTTLNQQWSWLNQYSANWSISGGTLNINAVSADESSASLAQNVLVENAPTTFNFVFQTQLAFEPTANFEQAGIVLYQDPTHYLKLVAESNSGYDETEWAKDTGTYWNTFLEVPGFSPAAKAAGGSGTWTWLRIVKQGDLVTAYTSIDGTTWTPGGTYNLYGFNSSETLYLGAMAGTAGANATTPAHFRYLRTYTFG
jgi:beta-xylosidase